MLQTITNTMVDNFFPTSCVLCHGLTDHEKLLCPSCLEQCHQAANPLFLLRPDAVGAVFYYELSVRKLMLRAKFSHSRLCADALLDALGKSQEFAALKHKIHEFSPVAVSAVPAHWSRKIFFPIDVPLLFGLYLARLLKVPFVPTLINRSRIRLSSLNKVQRKEAIKYRLVAIKRMQTIERLLLVDDIFTSGTTFDESKKVLKNMVGDIKCIAIAKTP